MKVYIKKTKNKTKQTNKQTNKQSKDDNTTIDYIYRVSQKKGNSTLKGFYGQTIMFTSRKYGIII